MYWKEVRAEAWTKTRAEFRSSTRRTIIIAVIGFMLVFGALSIMHLTIPITVIVGVGAAIGANLVYLFGQWCAYVFAIPPERERKIAEQLSKRDATIATLQAPRPDPIRVELTYVEFSVNTPTTSTAHINVTIRNSGIETTLESPRLRSVLYGDIATCITSQLGERAGIIEIGERKKKVGFASFRINSPIDQVRLPANKWWVEFTDIDGKSYRADIPPTSYVDLTRWQLPNP